MGMTIYSVNKIQRSLKTMIKSPKYCDRRKLFRIVLVKLFEAAAQARKWPSILIQREKDNTVLLARSSIGAGVM